MPKGYEGGSLAPSQETLDALSEHYGRAWKARFLDKEGERKIQERNRQSTIRKYLGNDYDFSKSEITDVLPEVPPPSGFIRDPLIIGGSKQFQQAARKLIDTSPWTKMNLQSVTVGPNSNTMELMQDKGLPRWFFRHPDLLNKENSLGGLTSNASFPYEGVDKISRIALNPNMNYAGLLGVLIHELGHAAGYGELGSDEARNLYYRNQPYTFKAPVMNPRIAGQPRPIR